MEFWGDQIELIRQLDTVTGEMGQKFEQFHLYPANQCITPRRKLESALGGIREELEKRVLELEREGQPMTTGAGATSVRVPPPSDDPPSDALSPRSTAGESQPSPPMRQASGSPAAAVPSCRAATLADRAICRSPTAWERCWACYPSCVAWATAAREAE